MKKMNIKLDERQEQKLLHIERNGCRLAFWALLASMFIQMGISGIENFRVIAGEWIVFMVLAQYLGLSCLKNGIWDRKLSPSPKTNLIISLLSAVIFGFIFAAVSYMNYKAWEGSAATFAVMSIILFIGIFAALSISSAFYKKRVQTLEKEYEE